MKLNAEKRKKSIEFMFATTKTVEKPMARTQHFTLILSLSTKMQSRKVTFYFSIIHF